MLDIDGAQKWYEAAAPDMAILKRVRALRLCLGLGARRSNWPGDLCHICFHMQSTSKAYVESSMAFLHFMTAFHVDTVLNCDYW